MLLGLQLTPTFPGSHGNYFDTTLAVTRAAEQAGLDSVWAADHFMFVDDTSDQEVPILECFTLLGALAASTQRIRIGQLVVGVPYRNPALLAKQLATLDVISHGRSIIGLGAAWHEPEFHAYGWPFPNVATRMAMLEEATQIVDRMLTQRPASFHGSHYTIENAYNDPQPEQKPRPPIMIGGSGERVTLRLVARYADMCNVFGRPSEVAHLFDVLHGHCAAVGRPYEAVTRSNHVSILCGRNDAEVARKAAQFGDFGRHGIAGTPDAVIERLNEYASAGSQYITFDLPDPTDIDTLELLGERVVPAVALF